MKPLFPHIRALAKWAEELEAAALRDGLDVPGDIVWSDHVDLIPGVDHEPRALQEVLMILGEEFRASRVDTNSPAAVERMLNNLGATAVTTIRNGADQEDTEPVAALCRSFVGADSSF